MKEKPLKQFDIFYNEQSNSHKELLDSFFADFNIRVLLDKKDKTNMRNDFENAILFYAKNGYTLEHSLEMLDLTRLGGFYARDTELWFPLDDGAKIYPLAMRHGQMSVFRLAVYLKEDIIPELLQMALNFTVKRFPSFATTLKKGFFWHYLDICKRRFFIQEEFEIPCQPLKVSQSRSQTFRVLYYKNRISVEFFHVLTDGTGGMIFLKALLVEYLRLLGVFVKDLDYEIDINTTPLAEEFNNEFENVESSDSPSGFIDKPACQMNGKLSKNNPCRMLHFKMNADVLKAVSKKYNVTVTTYFLTLMMLAGVYATDTIDQDYSIQVPVNMRKFYPSKTVRNFTMYCGVRLPIKDIKDKEELFSKIDEQLKTKSSLQPMKNMITSTKKMISNLKLIPLVIKQPVTKLVYGFLSDHLFSSILSNLGVVRLPEEISPYVLSMDFALGTSFFNRASCAAVTVNDITTFSISKHTLDPSFEEKMYELLLEDGIEVSVEGSGFYED